MLDLRCGFNFFVGNRFTARNDSTVNDTSGIETGAGKTAPGANRGVFGGKTGTHSSNDT